MTRLPRKPRSAHAIAARRTPGAGLWIERAAFILGVILFVLSIVTMRILTEPERHAPGTPGASATAIEWNDHG